MIDDTNPKRPIESVSFHDLESLGLTVYVQEFEKEKPDGASAIAVKVIKVTKDVEGVKKEITKEGMQHLLYTLGIETYDPSLRWWVCPKKKHRCLSTKEPVYHYRYQGYSRLDDDYLKSGRASREAIEYGSCMADMTDHLDQLRKGGDD